LSVCAGALITVTAAANIIVPMNFIAVSSCAILVSPKSLTMD
jgi:hypothetical protein